jgi:hypothetical protein
MKAGDLTNGRAARPFGLRRFRRSWFKFAQSLDAAPQAVGAFGGAGDVST